MLGFKTRMNRSGVAVLVLLAVALGGVVTWVALSSWVEEPREAAGRGHHRSPEEARSAKLAALAEEIGRLGADVRQTLGPRLQAPLESAADESTRDKLKEMLGSSVAELRTELSEARDRHGTASAEGRVRILKRFASAHAMYVMASRDFAFLPFLRSVAERSRSKRERTLSVISLHRLSDGPVVALLIELTDSSFPGVRFYAAEGLGWVRGEHANRAHKHLRGLFAHEDPEVRSISIISWAVLVGDPSVVGKLLELLPKESRSAVVESIALAVTKLDAKAGRARLEGALGDLTAESKEAVRRVLEGR